jgi:hypothetical protein
MGMIPGRPNAPSECTPYGVLVSTGSICIASTHPSSGRITSPIDIHRSLLEVIAIGAIEIADRPMRLGHDVKRFHRHTTFFLNRYQSLGTPPKEKPTRQILVGADREISGDADQLGPHRRRLPRGCSTVGVTPMQQQRILWSKNMKLRFLCDRCAPIEQNKTCSVG